MYSEKATNFCEISTVDLSYDRAIGRSENPGVSVLFGGHNLPPLVEIGLSDLPTGTPGTPRDDRPELDA